jgi:hypothetical protein
MRFAWTLVVALAAILLSCESTSKRSPATAPGTQTAPVVGPADRTSDDHEPPAGWPADAGSPDPTSPPADPAEQNPLPPTTPPERIK